MKRTSSKVMPSPPEMDGEHAGATAPPTRPGALAPLGPLAPLPNRPLLTPLGAAPVPPLGPQRPAPIPPLPAQQPPSNTAPAATPQAPATSQPAAAPPDSQPPAAAGLQPPGRPAPSAPSPVPPVPPPPPPPAPLVVASGVTSVDTREPADIASLASPAAGPSGPHVAAPLMSAAAAPAAAAPPSQSPPAAAPQLQQQRPVAAPQAPPERPAPPPRPAAVVIPGGGAGGKGGTPGAPGSTPKAGPVPPPSPPPPELLKATSVANKADLRPVEEYIPFGFVELRGRLVSDHPDVFRDPETRRKFEELCKWMSLRNTLRLALDYGDAHDKYAPLDPDKDTLAFKKANDPSSHVGSGGVSPGRVVPSGTIRERVSEFSKELSDIMDKAEFEEMPQEDLDKAKNDKSLMGVDMIPASDEFLDFKVYYRGSRLKKVMWRRWGVFKRQIEMSVYERLAISFRLKKPVSSDDEPADRTALGLDSRPWYKRMCCGKQVSVSASLSELRDEFVYLKLFKDVLQCDVDMLLPGATIKFTWLDYLMIWVPILVGCGCAVWKAIKGTIHFDNIKDAVLSVVLILMPLTWAIRAYQSVKEKERLHQSRLNALMLLHNLNNNGGVISQLIEEAQEQEDNEAMLAYFFLWRGAASPAPMRKVDLDRAVEAYLQAKLDDAGCAIRMDFEVVDSVLKLERMGLLQTVLGNKGEKMLQAVPLDAAFERAHVRNFDESVETGHFLQPRSRTKRQGALAMAWHECVDVFRPTGQAFRYWWNAETGESTYYEPDEPYVKLGAAAAVDLGQAHGAALQDPAKYSSVRDKKA